MPEKARILAQIERIVAIQFASAAPNWDRCDPVVRVSLFFFDAHESTLWPRAALSVTRPDVG